METGAEGGSARPAALHWKVRHGVVDCRFGGFCTDINLFDAKFFRLSATEAAALDPQQRILMEETRQALASAHGASSQFSASNSATGPASPPFTPHCESLQCFCL